MRNFIIPAVIASNQSELDTMIDKVKDIVEIIQLDIMDGKFVPNPSINFEFTLPRRAPQFEAHLMIKNPEAWIEEYGYKVDTLLVHFEATKKPAHIIELAKDMGKRIGFVINPETPVSAIKEYLDQINQVLVMTVNPGFYGAKFLPETLKKVTELRELNPKMDIEVDGGINDETILQAKEAGANLFCCGSYIMKAESAKNSIDTLKRIVGN